MKINRKLFAILAPLFLISNEKTSIIKSHYIVNNTKNEAYFQIEYTLSKVRNETPHPIRLLAMPSLITKQETLKFESSYQNDYLSLFFQKAQSSFETDKYSKELIGFYNALGLPEQEDLSFSNNIKPMTEIIDVDGTENKYGVYVPVLYSNRSTIYKISFTSPNATSKEEKNIIMEVTDSCFCKVEYFKTLDSYNEYRESNNLK